MAQGKMTLAGLKRKIICSKLDKVTKDHLSVLFLIYGNDYECYLVSQGKKEPDYESIIKRTKCEASEIELSVALFGIFEKGQTVEQARENWYEHMTNPSIQPYISVLREYASLSSSRRSFFAKSILHPISHSLKSKKKKTLQAKGKQKS